MPLFKSFFMGGFECSTHRLPTGKRLDMLAATRHDQFFQQDFERLTAYDIRTIRHGIRWTSIETSPYRYDFSGVLPLVRAAHNCEIQVIWDILHYGYPDDIDPFSTEFIRRLRALALEFAHILANETDSIPFIVPVNEISFFSWAGGEEGIFNPFAVNRGYELKQQYVRAAIEVCDALWTVLPDARIVHTDPVINILAKPTLRTRQHIDTAEGHRRAQYQAWDMLQGTLSQHLGGNPRYLDILGLNYYSNNQWYYKGRTITRRNPEYKPFRVILREVYERYHRPIFIAETGAEAEHRRSWFRYVCGEVAAAIDDGIPIEGICLYPIVNFPGWDDERHCHNGLWDFADENGLREIYQPLARELQRQQRRFRKLFAH